MPSCGFVLALDVPAMAEVAFVALILDRGTAPLPNATRPSQVPGRRRRRTDDETKETRVFSPRVDVARDRRVPVRPPRSAYGVNQLVPSCRWGKTPRERARLRWKRPSTRPREGDVRRTNAMK